MCFKKRKNVVGVLTSPSILFHNCLNSIPDLEIVEHNSIPGFVVADLGLNQCLVGSRESVDMDSIVDLIL